MSAVEVIEHVPDPRGLLKYLAGLLKSGGVLYVQTGNWNLVRRIHGTPYLMPEGHIRYFTPQIMRRLFRETGLCEVNVLNRSWFPYRDAPRAVRNVIPTIAYTALASLSKALVPGIAPFPVGRRESSL